MAKQAEHRQNIDVGPRMGQVSSVMYWYQAGKFRTDDEARGAFELAYQQGVDGMGQSVEQWMGLTDEQFGWWMRDPTWLPPRKHRVRRSLEEA